MTLSKDQKGLLWGGLAIVGSIWIYNKYLKPEGSSNGTSSFSGWGSSKPSIGQWACTCANGAQPPCQTNCEDCCSKYGGLASVKK